VFKQKPPNLGAHDAEDLVRAAGPKYDVQHVGDRLRAMRVIKGLTVNALAAMSQVPASTISKMENGRLQPSLVHAINLAMALGENLGFLVDSYRAEPEDVVVVSSSDRSRIDYPELGMTLEDLNGNFHSGVLEARISILQPGATSGAEPMMHFGDEFCVVLDGAVRYEVEGESYELKQGDTLHFKSDQEHAWLNIHDGCTTLLMVFSNGLSF
jgi:quercetin dioxygenase-like cupin family protein/DNA-binding XRE family transcriptional regulator